MKSLMRKISLVLTVFLSVCWSVPCRAAENTFNDIFFDSLFGGIGGTLVGAAVMAIAKKPGESLDFMAYGAASGVLIGGAYGVGKAMVEMQNGKVKLSMPTIIPDFQQTNSKGQTPLIIMAQLLRGKF